VKQKVLKYILPIMFVIVIILSITARIWHNKMLFNQGFAFGGYNPAYLFVIWTKFTLIFIVLLIAIITSAYILRKYNIGILFGLRLDITVVIASFICPILIWWNLYPDIPPFMDGYRQYVIKHVDIDSLIDWLNNNKSDKFHIEEPNWPDEIKSLYPNYVEIYKDRSYMKVTCGGGFTHWGLVVDPENNIENFINKETDMNEKVCYVRDIGGYILKVQNCIYIWSEVPE